MMRQSKALRKYSSTYTTKRNKKIQTYLSHMIMIMIIMSFYSAKTIKNIQKRFTII